MGDVVAQFAQSMHKNRGVGRHPLGNALQALRAVVDGIHACHDCWQYLGGADVGGGFFAADVLLAGLQRQPVGRMAVAVNADADQTAGQRALEFVAAGQVSGMRTTVSHGHAEALGAAQHNVRIPFAGRREQGQRQQIGSDAQRGSVGMRLPCQRPQVMNGTAGSRVLRQHAEVAAFGHEERYGA